LRIAALDRIPGINGDEAWFGVQVEERLAHRPAFERTPSGLPLDPFHVVPLEFISRIAAPSFWALRFPAAFWNVLALVLAYPLLSRPFGGRPAFLTTVFIAISPAAITYSRISWEPSETVFFSLLVVALAALGRTAAALFTFACSLLAHPTNVFLFPVLVGACAGAWWSAVPSKPKIVTLPSLLGLAAVLVVALFMGRFVLGEAPGLARGIGLPEVSTIWMRAIDPQQWVATIRGLLRLLSGVTTGRSIAGPFSPGAETAIETGGFLLLMMMSVLAIPSWRREPQFLFTGIALGFLVTIIGFHLAAGPDAIGAPHERYALVFVVPSCVLIAMLIETIRRSRVWVASSLAAAWTALGIFSFATGYAIPFLRDGGNAHLTYRTGAVEPKKAAIDFVSSELKAGETAAVLADSWWMYWPLRYLAIHESDRIRIEPAGFRHPPVMPPGADAPSFSAPPSRGFAIAFADSSPLRIPDSDRETFVAKDPRGRPILRGFELQPRPGGRVIR
jgi:hypothetical protein